MKAGEMLELFNDAINRSRYENDKELGLVFYPSIKAIMDGLDKSMA